MLCFLQRKQKDVEKENHFYIQLLQQALPSDQQQSPTDKQKGEPPEQDDRENQHSSATVPMLMLRKHENIFAFSIISQHWDHAGSSNPSPWKACIYCIVNTMIANNWEGQGAWSSAVIVLTKFSQNIISVPEWLPHLPMGIMILLHHLINSFQDAKLIKWDTDSTLISKTIWFQQGLEYHFFFFSSSFTGQVPGGSNFQRGAAFQHIIFVQ